jgi:hypothetical protein
MDDAIARFLSNGGEVTKLRYANQKDLNKSSRNFYHRDKAICGSVRSEEIISKAKQKESVLIFTREARWKIDE